MIEAWKMLAYQWLFKRWAVLDWMRFRERDTTEGVSPRERHASWILASTDPGRN